MLPRPHLRTFRLLLCHLLLLLSLLTLVTSAMRPVASQTLPTAFDAGTDASAGPFVNVILELDAPPVAAIYAELMANTASAAIPEVAPASISAATQAYLATVEGAQQAVLSALTEVKAAQAVQVIYRTQRVYNGVALRLPLAALGNVATLPGVKAVHPLVPKVPDNGMAARIVGVPALWHGLDGSGLTGTGISIAVVDTGIDYLHTMFGGPGTGYADNDTTRIGDVTGFPSVKVAGGYDFVGDSYNANANSTLYQPMPAPDPDPMDCYSFGHGTHVAGTAAGYGVQNDGSTYAGSYDNNTDLGDLRIAPGMAPQARIYALKVFGCTGSSEVVDMAVEWAVDPNQDGDFSDRVDVMNLSLGASFGATYDATSVAVENAAKLGVIVVASAGNSGDVTYGMGSPGVAASALTVAASTLIDLNPQNRREGLADFSARGPRRGDGALKPDLAAPGVNLFSARQGGGSTGTSSSGTSMAAPVVAGVMALLREARPAVGQPGWSATELKALVMNTAYYPLVSPVDGVAYSIARAGAGRIDPVAALQSDLIAYRADAPSQVSLGFGVVDALGSASAVQLVRLANKGSVPISVTVGYTGVRDLPGVTLHVDAGRVITVPARGFATLPVTLTLDSAAMQRQVDPARSLPATGALAWIDEVGGYLLFTPAPEVGPPLHLPVYALPRPIANLTLNSAPLDAGNAVTATFPLTLTGLALTGLPPTQTVSLISFFDLIYSSPPITTAPTGDSALDHYASGDLQHVGLAGPLLVAGEEMLYVAVTTYGAWATPQEVVVQIDLDINGDEAVDYRLSNRDRPYVETFNPTVSDDFVAVLEQVNTTMRHLQGPLNIYPPTAYDTRLFNNNVMILPLRLDDLGAEVTQLNYRISTFTRDINNATALDQAVDRLDWQPVTLQGGSALVVTAVEGEGSVKSVQATAAPLFEAAARAEFRVHMNRTQLVARGAEGLLVLHHHNPAGERVQTLPVTFTWPHQLYLPALPQARP